VYSSGSVATSSSLGGVSATAAHSKNVAACGQSGQRQTNSRHRCTLVVNPPQQSDPTSGQWLYHWPQSNKLQRKTTLYSTNLTIRIVLLHYCITWPADSLKATAVLIKAVCLPAPQTSCLEAPAMSSRGRPLADPLAWLAPSTNNNGVRRALNMAFLLIIIPRFHNDQSGIHVQYQCTTMCLPLTMYQCTTTTCHHHDAVLLCYSCACRHHDAA
jgi:hypothetical protein